MPLVKLDRRTRLGRRVGELSAHFTKALGGPSAISPLLATKIADAAQLKAIAERARADYLGGRKVSLGHVVRIERRADNAVKALHLPEAKPKPMSFRDRLAQVSGGPT